MRRIPVATLIVLAAAGCVRPAAPPPPVPQARPAPPPVVAPVMADWRDRPLTSGSWIYQRDERGSIALYGVAGSPAALTIRCDRTAAAVLVSRPGLAGQLTLRATTGDRTYTAQPTSGETGYVAARMNPRDPNLDALAFSRGRFLVAMPGAADTIVPTWPEVTRVIEDCR